MARCHGESLVVCGGNNYSIESLNHTEMKIRITLFVLLITSFVYAQEHPQKYFPAKDSLVQRKLEWWSDSKFGLLMHWGTYSQWGIVESWSICPEDEDWCRRRGPY